MRDWLDQTLAGIRMIVVGSAIMILVSAQLASQLPYLEERWEWNCREVGGVEEPYL
jgi:hypothetical protein